MRSMVLAALVLVGCTNAQMVTAPGYPVSPYAPANEQWGGVVKYRNSGPESWRAERREDAYRQMFESCGGPYQIVAEGPRVAGASVVATGTHSAVAVPIEDWYIEFACVSPYAAR